MAEQRYQAVLAVIKDGRTVTETAAAVGVSRQSLYAWLGKYEVGGLDGLVDGSHRPLTSPQQMPAAVEAAALEARRKHPPWGPRRIARAHQDRPRPGGDRVVGVSVSAAGRCDGAGWSAATQTGVEAMGARAAERAVAPAPIEKPSELAPLVTQQLAGRRPNMPRAQHRLLPTGPRGG